MNYKIINTTDFKNLGKIFNENEIKENNILNLENNFFFYIKNIKKNNKMLQISNSNYIIDLQEII